jgi:hypothetical protein
MNGNIFWSLSGHVLIVFMAGMIARWLLYLLRTRILQFRNMTGLNSIFKYNVVIVLQLWM